MEWSTTAEEGNWIRAKQGNSGAYAYIS